MTLTRPLLPKYCRIIMALTTRARITTEARPRVSRLAASRRNPTKTKVTRNRYLRSTPRSQRIPWRNSLWIREPRIVRRSRWSRSGQGVSRRKASRLVTDARIPKPNLRINIVCIRANQRKARLQARRWSASYPRPLTSDIEGRDRQIVW